jgi:hypothetical protein
MLRYLGHSPFGVCNRPHHLQRFPNQRSAGDLRRFQVSIILSEQPSRVATVITGYPEVIHLDEKPAPQGEQVTYNPVFQQLRLGWRKVTCPDSRLFGQVTRGAFFRTDPARRTKTVDLGSGGSGISKAPCCRIHTLGGLVLNQ